MEHDSTSGGVELKPSIMGALRVVVILSIAVKGETYGYEIVKTIEAITRGYWRPSLGTIYRVIHELEANGVIECRSASDGRRVRRLCKLTERGVEEARRLAVNGVRNISAIFTLFLRALSVIEPRLADECKGVEKSIENLVEKLVSIYSG